MNKWQIICPLAAIVLLVLVFGLIEAAAHRNSPDTYLAAASLVGRDLVTKTNSVRLVSATPALMRDLKELLASPARLDSVQQETSTDKHRIAAAVRLVNEEDKRLNLHLRWDPHLRKFTLLTHEYPAEPPHGN